MSTAKTKIGWKDHLQILLLIGMLTTLGYGIQSCSNWRQKLVIDKFEPEIVSGTVKSINLISDPYSVTFALNVRLSSNEVATMLVSHRRAASCEIGESVKLEKRGMNYRLSDEGCHDD